jgi:hypothetical protein
MRQHAAFTIPVNKLYNNGMNEETLNELKIGDGKTAIGISLFKIITLKPGV